MSIGVERFTAGQQVKVRKRTWDGAKWVDLWEDATFSHYGKGNLPVVIMAQGGDKRILEDATWLKS